MNVPVAEHMRFYDVWGSPVTTPHMSVAWSWAFDTPFKWTKQIASHFRRHPGESPSRRAFVRFWREVYPHHSTPSIEWRLLALDWCLELIARHVTNTQRRLALIVRKTGSFHIAEQCSQYSAEYITSAITSRSVTFLH